MQRLLLISNENAYRTTAYQRKVIPRALAAEFKVDVAGTTQPGDANAVALLTAITKANLAVDRIAGGHGGVAPFKDLQKVGTVGKASS